MSVHNILEVANVHGGNFDELMGLIDDYAGYSAPQFGIKFQPFKYNRIATADHAWYSVYQELFFDPAKWTIAIDAAAKTKLVWIDTFDTYSAEIIKANLSKIHGLKFQASVVHNQRLIDALAQINLSKQVLVVNISGYPIEQIAALASDLSARLQPKALHLQIGFQAYPTALEDSGLGKIGILRQAFPNLLISYTEHLDPNDVDSRLLPAIAAQMGVSSIEKHVRRTGEPPKYDHYSSSTPEQYAEYVALFNRYQKAVDQPFINQSETDYLKNSYQVPLLDEDLEAGDVVAPGHLSFRRSPQTGLTYPELIDTLASRMVLAQPKKAGQTLQSEDFRPAKIGALIACRLKSTRLPKKAVLDIEGLSATELCVKHSMMLPVDKVVLATSDLKDDAELAGHTHDPSVLFFQGDPVDVMRRFLDAATLHDIDTIVRITADCQYPGAELTDLLLDAHFRTGADFTRPKKAAIGTGLEIISTKALARAKTLFPKADYSEYMTYYFINNPSKFRITEIDLPQEMIRDYRLTLDYPEDLEMFREVQRYFNRNRLEFSLPRLFEFLDKNPQVAKMNQGMNVKYLQDPDLIETLRRVTTLS